MPMPSDTRTRMIEATVHALQWRGVAGMSFTDVLRASGAARGAIYHHFPGGKAQLVAEAAARNGQDVRIHLAGLPADSPQAVVRAFLAAVRPAVEASAAGGGCAVAAITVGADADNDGLRQVAADALASWADQLAELLTSSGLASGEAADLAAMLIALLQGAHVMCRAAGTLQPFDQAARAVTALAHSRYGGLPAPQSPAGTTAP
jgi:TetR/AcrR family transcriptional regulator, lmrAB and yxaGH operons repressor